MPDIIREDLIGA